MDAQIGLFMQLLLYFLIFFKAGKHILDDNCLIKNYLSLLFL